MAMLDDSGWHKPGLWEAPVTTFCGQQNIGVGDSQPPPTTIPVSLQSSMVQYVGTDGFVLAAAVRMHSSSQGGKWKMHGPGKMPTCLSPGPGLGQSF